jgi:hypothetical protein
MFCLRSRPRLSVHNLIQNFRRRACRLWGLQSLTRSAGLAWHRKHRTCLRLRLRAQSAPLGRSKSPREPARFPWGARDGRSSPVGSAGALEMAARTRSNSLGSAGALEIAWPGWSKALHLPTLRFRARPAPLGRSTLPLEPARLRWGARNGRSNSLGFARALEIVRPGC